MMEFADLLAAARAIAAGLEIASGTAALLAAGLAVFGLAMGHRLSEAELDRLRGAIGLTAALSAGALVLRWAVAAVIVGVHGVPALAHSVEGGRAAALLLGLAGVATLMLRWRPAPAFAGAGLVLVVLCVAGFTAPLRLAHAASAAVWAGSLWPLIWVADRGDRAAAGLIEDWAKPGAAAAGLTLATGALAAVLRLWPFAGLTMSAGVSLLLAKAALLLVAAGLALRHHLVLVPELAKGWPDAPGRLMLSLRMEFAALAAALALGFAMAVS